VLAVDPKKWGPMTQNFIFRHSPENWARSLGHSPQKTNPPLRLDFMWFSNHLACCQHGIDITCGLANFKHSLAIPAYVVRRSSDPSALNRKINQNEITEIDFSEGSAVKILYVARHDLVDQLDKIRHERQRCRSENQFSCDRAIYSLLKL